MAQEGAGWKIPGTSAHLGRCGGVRPFPLLVKFICMKICGRHFPFLPSPPSFLPSHSYLKPGLGHKAHSGMAQMTSG